MIRTDVGDEAATTVATLTRELAAAARACTCEDGVLKDAAPVAKPPLTLRNTPGTRAERGLVALDRMVGLFTTEADVRVEIDDAIAAGESWRLCKFG